MRSLLVAAVVIPGSAWAEPVPASGSDPGNDLRVVAVANLPVEGWAEVAGLGLGATVVLGVPVARDTSVSVRAGAVVHLPVTTSLGARTRLIEIPFLGGARYRVAERGSVRGFLMGEVGVIVARTDVTVAGLSDDDTDVRFGSVLGAGFEVGRVELTAAAWLADLSDLDHGIGFSLTAGARLGSW